MRERERGGFCALLSFQQILKAFSGTCADQKLIGSAAYLTSSLGQNWDRYTLS